MAVIPSDIGTTGIRAESDQPRSTPRDQQQFLDMLAQRPDSESTPTIVLEDDIASATADLKLAGYAIVHTDGGCEPNPGTGGWGVVIDAAPGRKIELCGGERSTTNNRMEMTAAIVALTVLPPTCAITIVSDSQYLIKGMTTWLEGWRRRGFEKKGLPIPNADLWRNLDALSAGRAISWKWVRGHNGHDLNEHADQLASQGRMKAMRAPAGSSKPQVIRSGRAE